MNCLKCNRELKPIGIPDIYPCFDCMELIVVRKAIAKDNNDLRSSISLSRRGPQDWKIGSHAQTHKNQIWEQQIEKAYALWLTKRIAE